MEPCSPVPDRDSEAPRFYCLAEGRDPWEITLEVEEEALDPDDVRAAHAILGQVIQAHDHAHPQVVLPVRNATPKFRAGLGMNPGTRITEAGSSVSPR